MEVVSAARAAFGIFIVLTYDLLMIWPASAMALASTL